MEWPLTVVSTRPFPRSQLNTSPWITWYCNTSRSALASFMMLFISSVVSLPNASLVGTRIVYGPWGRENGQYYLFKYVCAENRRAARRQDTNTTLPNIAASVFKIYIICNRKTKHIGRNRTTRRTWPMVESPNEAILLHLNTETKQIILEYAQTVHECQIFQINFTDRKTCEISTQAAIRLIILPKEPML